MLSHSTISAYPSILPAPEHDLYILAWRLLDCKNGVFCLDSNTKGARDLRHAMWEVTMPEELFRATPRWVQVLIHVEYYLPTSPLVSQQTVMTTSAAHHVLFKKVSSCCIRWGTGLLHGATVELEQQPWLLTLPIVIAASAFALSTSAVYSWRKERGVDWGRDWIWRQTLEMCIWSGGETCQVDVAGSWMHSGLDYSKLSRLTAGVSTPPVITILVYFWKSHITHFWLAKSIVDNTCIFDQARPCHHCQSMFDMTAVWFVCRAFLWTSSHKHTFG